MSGIWKILVLLRSITPEMRAAIDASLSAMEAEARKTNNPIDDLAMGVIRTLCRLLGVV